MEPLCYSCMDGIFGGSSTKPFTTTLLHRAGCFCTATVGFGGGEVADEPDKLDTTSSRDCRNTTLAAPPAGSHPVAAKFRGTQVA